MPTRAHRSDEDGRDLTRDGSPQPPASNVQERAPRTRARQVILVLAMLAVPVVVVSVLVAVVIALVVTALNRVIRPPMEGAGELQWLAVSPGGRYVSGIPYNGGHRLIVWDADTRECRDTISLPTEGRMDGYAVSPDGQQVAVLIDRKVIFYSLPGGRAERTVPLSPWQGGEDRSPWITYTPDGTAVITPFEQALVRIDRVTGAETVVLTGLRTENVRYAADADRVVELGPFVAGKGREVRVIDPARGPLSAFRIQELEYLYDREFDVSADGTVVAVGATSPPEGGGPATVHLYDTRTGRRTASFPIVPAGAVNVQFDSIRLSPNGGQVAASVTIYPQKTLVRILADVRTGVARPFGPASEVHGMIMIRPEISAFGPDGKWFAYLVRDGVRSYDVDAGADR